jgi:hypothetical protein
VAGEQVPGAGLGPGQRGGDFAVDQPLVCSGRRDGTDGGVRRDLPACLRQLGVRARLRLGALFIAYALIGYPLVGVLGGHALRVVPAFGVSPCASVVFFFGLLLWAIPPAPKFVLLVPLAWSLGAAPPDLARGVAADYGMLAAALITAGLIIWRTAPRPRPRRP